ncbi:hypothetical protein TURU_008937 [Turdus rufiventris]|nr:hypothetical protein TURU_008937 [Turdus rufiventris]
MLYGVPYSQWDDIKLEETWVPQSSILGPVLFNIFINYLGAGLKGILSTFTNDTKLVGTVNFLEDREALWRNSDKIEDWAITSSIKFNKGKCWILHLGWGKAGCVYRLGSKKLKSSSIEWDLGVTRVSESAVPWQPGWPPVSWDASGTASQLGKEEDCPLCSELGQPHLECWGQVWVTQWNKDIELRECPKEGNEDGEGLEEKPYEEQLRSLGLEDTEE